MKTLICTKPGLLEYADSAKPVLSRGNAIIRIKKIGVCGTDLHAFEGTQPFFNYPRILGHELSGELIDVDGTQEFELGETVTFIPYLHCSKCIACVSGKPNCCSALQVCGVHIDGGMREYFSVPAYSLIHGNGLSEEALALVEPLAIGAHGIKRAAVEPNEFVLVIGAGPIGLGVMEFARIAGGKVIALDINQHRLDFCKANLGVRYTIDGSIENTEEQLRKITDGQMPSVVIDATGNLNAINQGFLFMAHGARYVLIGLQKENISFSHPEFHKREGTLMSSRNATREDFDFVIGTIRQGLIDPTNYITHNVNFDQVKKQFNDWLNPSSKVIKAMITVY